MIEIACELDRAAGVDCACPGSPCAFWADSHCLLRGSLPVWETNPELVHLLRDLKRELSVPHGRALVPPGLRD